MNKDTHLLFEAYRKINEAFEYFGSSASKSEGNESQDSNECGEGCTCGKCEKCTPEYVEKHVDKEEAGEESKKSKHGRSHYEGAAKVVHHVLKDKHDGDTLAEHMKKHMKKIYGDDYDEKKAEHAVKKAIGSKAEDDETEDDEAETAKHPDKKLSDRSEKGSKRDTTQNWELSNKKD
jgi:hypothetical protein